MPKSANDWNEEGQTFRNQGNYAKAIRCYEQALAIDPKYKWAWFGKGFALARQDNYVEAIRCFNEALAIDPKYKEAWYCKGLAMNSQGNYVEAIRCYEQVLAIDPKDTSAWRGKGLAMNSQGRVLEEQGNYVEAIRCYEQVLAIDPKDTSAWNKKGNVLKEQGNYVEAIRCFDQALGIDPKDRLAWHNKGYVLKAQGNYGEAIRCYEQALAIDPKDTSAWHNKGYVLKAQGNYVEAIRCYDQTLAINPKDTFSWNNKGKVLKFQSNYVEAIRCYDQTLAIDPQNNVALNNKGVALFCQNPTVVEVIKEALSYFEEVLRRNSRSFFAIQGKAVVYVYQGRSIEAEALFEQVAQLTKNEYDKIMLASLLCDRGDMFFAIEKFQEAREAFEEAKLINPSYVPAQERLLKVLEAMQAAATEIISSDPISSPASSSSLALSTSYATLIQLLSAYTISYFKTAAGLNFHHSLSRGEAENSLKKHAPGAFLFRPSNQPNSVALSYKTATGVAHTSIQLLSDGKINDNGNIISIEAYFRKHNTTLLVPVSVDQPANKATPQNQYLPISAVPPVSSTPNDSKPIQLLNDYLIVCFTTPAEANFYHLISRETAETLLKNYDSGAFLFRSSSQADAIALSYKERQEISHITFELLSDGTIRDDGKIITMADYFLLHSQLLTQPISVGEALNPTLRRNQSQYKTLSSTCGDSSPTNRSSASVPASQSSPISLMGLALQDHQQAIKQIAEQERQVFLGLLQMDYQKSLAEYQRLGQQGFESNFQLQQQCFTQYLTTQQRKLQGQGTRQQNQFADALQTALAQYQGQVLASLSDHALQAIQEQLRTTLGPEFTDNIQNLLNSQHYQEEIQHLQQGILQRIQERQGQLGIEMIHVQQKQKQIANEHDPLFKQYQAQKQKLAEQNELQKQEAVRVFYNTIEKVLGSRLMSAMSLASGMLTRASTNTEDAAGFTVNVAEKVINLIPVIGPVANVAISAGLELGQTIHGKYVDKKQDKKFQNTLDCVIRLEDAIALAELVARRLTQCYQKHITENYLSAEETEAAGENAANIVYGCIKSGGLKALATMSLDEKVAHLVNVVNAEAQKQKGIFFHKGGVFKEPASAQLSAATRNQVHALGADLSKVQEQNELVAKQAQMKLQHMEKEQALMKAEFERMKKIHAAPPTHQFLPLPYSPLQQPASPLRRPASPSFFIPPAATPAVAPVTASLLVENTWAVAIEQLRQSTLTTLLNIGNLQIQRTEKKLTLSTTRQLPSIEKDFEVLGEMIKKMFSGDVEDWEVEQGIMVITVEASQKAKKLEVFFGQVFVEKPEASLIGSQK